ncbi:MAG TPA: YceI family protein [Albitalea sp.]|nr:YceI family protein [Albitalea sp.]
MRAIVAAAVVVVGLAGTVPAARAQAQAAPSYRLDPAHTQIQWEVLHNGTSTSRGRFERVSGSVQFDPAAQRLEVGVTVDTASASTGHAGFDAVIRGAQLLASGEYPQAYFSARQARWEGGVPREVQGEITLRGVSQPLALRALRWHCGTNLLIRRPVCGGDFEGELNRSDFGITYGLPFAADKVRLVIEVEGIRA